MTQNVRLAALAKAGHWARALEVLVAMREAEEAEARKPDLVSFNTTLQALESASKWEHVLALLQETPDPDLRSLGSAITACAKGGDWHRALSLMKSMQERLLTPDLPCHTAMLTAFRRSQSWALGLQYLKQLLETEKLDAVGYDAALGICEAGCWQEAVWVLEESRSQGCQPTVSGLCSAIAALKASDSPAALPYIESLYEEITQHALQQLEEMRVDCQSDAAIKLRVSRGVQTVLALDALHAEGRRSQTLEDAFREVVLRPTMLELQRSASKESSKLAGQHGLGVLFTGEALLQLGIASGHEDEWLVTATWWYSGTLLPPFFGF